MIKKIEAYKAEDGKLFASEEEAYNHDTCNVIKGLLANSNVYIEDRYSFARDIVVPYAEEWVKTLVPLIEYKKRKSEVEVASGWPTDYKVKEAETPPAFKDWPGAEVRIVGGTVVDDEVPF